MEFGWPEELRTFRAEVLAFIENAMTPELRTEIAGLGHGERGGKQVRAVQDEVDRRGWLRKSWPVEDGVDVVHLQVLHLHVPRGGAGQREEREAGKLRDDLAPVHELRESDSQLEKLTRLQLDPGDGD